MFIRTEAVFLLVWDVKTEETLTQIETLPTGKIITYKNYPIKHWLSYIKILGNNSPVILVQTQRNRDKQQTILLNDAQQKEYNINAMLSVESSATIANGYETLKEKIQEIVVEQIKKTCTDIPRSWYNVRKQIAALQEQKEPPVKQLLLHEFEAICSREQLDSGSTKTLLNYFHNNGIFFYQQGLFNNQIVLDQKWAIDAVYTLFDRTGSFARIHHNGRFTGQDLKEAWQQYTLEEQQLFVSFMQQCEICFELNTKKIWRSSFVERVFIAPQLLPDTKPNLVLMAFETNEGVYFKYRHTLLHAAIIQRFIVRVGHMANLHEMWKDGIIIQTTEGKALIEADTEKNEIAIRLKDVAQTALLNKIRNEMKYITQDEPGIEELVSLNGKAFVNLEKLKTCPAINEQIQAEDGTWVPVSHLRVFTRYDENQKFETPEKMSNKQPEINSPEIFFSYAWGEEREKIVDALYDSLNSARFNVIRDKKDLHYKDLISDFMKRIGRGNFIIVALSDKYLKSENCMFELYEIFRNSGLEKAELIKKLYPIRVESLNLSSPKIIAEYFTHWQNKRSEWEELIRQLGNDIQGPQLKQYEKIKKIIAELGELLDLLKDINSLTKEELSKDNFAAIKDAIEERTAGMK